VEPQIAEDEELQKVREWWKTNGTAILVGIGIGIAALAGFNGFKLYTESQSESASTLFSQFQSAISEEKLDKANALAEDLKLNYDSSPYTASALLISAAEDFRSENVDLARQKYAWVIANQEDGAMLHTARLRMAYIEIDTGNAEAALVLLDVENTGGYGSQYAELKADAHKHSGNNDEAAKWYAEAITALPAGSAYTEILQAKQAASQ
jgi:predicted negative regulator of RcsB-dependent stress response